jgi:hypothetical protein
MDDEDHRFLDFGRSADLAVPIDGGGKPGNGKRKIV